MPLLATKLIPPRRGRGTLPRPRLEQLIEQMAHATLTVLKAPPGFGKSTLASAWAQAALARGARVAWLTLDETDATPERLLLHVAAAVQRGFKDDLEQDLIKDLLLLPGDQLGILLLNELERSSQSSFLFIDDYHSVPPQVLISAFDKIIRYAPDNLHLVFCGRSDLPPALYAHLYSDACLEIDVGQLRFDLDETRDLLLRSGLEAVDAGEVLDLHKATEGWIAALRASLLSLRQQPAGSFRLPKSISGLLDELLERLPPELAGQLPHLASVERFNATLAQALTGHTDGHALIEDIERLQLFLTGLDDSGEWFSFHPLFREHLRRRLQAWELNTALRCAAHWFAAEQLWTDAVRCALAAGDNESAQEWITHCAIMLVERADFIILLDWQRQLQDHLLQSPPQLKLALAWASGLAMTRSNSRQLLDEVKAEWTELQRFNEQDDLYWECQALHAMLLALDDQAEIAGRLAEQCLPHLKEHPWICNTLQCVVGYGHLGACRWEAFYSVPPTICAPLERSRYLANQVYRLTLMGLGEILQGRFSQAAAILEEALRCSSREGSEQTQAPVLRAMPASFLANVRYMQGRLDEAARLSLENIEIAKLGGFLDCAASVFVTASGLSSNRGSLQGARSFLEDGERLAHTREWPRMHAQLLLERTRISLLEHKHHEALACAQQLEALQLGHPPPASDSFDEYQCLASLASLWCEAAGLSRQADLAKAEHLGQLAMQHNHRLMQIRLAASRALVSWQRQQPDSAVRSLLEACSLVEATGARQLLADLPSCERLQQLAAYALQQDISLSEQAQLQQLLPGAVSATQLASQLRTAISLTSKERNVLKLVAEGKSNKEMAKLLGITPETIKSHMKNIFGKLNVDSRAQAAVAAKASGFI
jgi:LuxR family maltose regulon positive regulatory protein